MAKIYIDVIAEFTTDGRLLPRTVVWEDGRRFRINRVIDSRRAVSLKAGGTGIRYRCDIEGRIRDIYHENGNLWFVEGR